MKWNLSFGIGGHSALGGRKSDTFGMGCYYGAASDELGPFFNPNDGAGMELFYNIAVTPRFQLTPDLQVIDGGVQVADTAVVFGLRGNLSF